MSIASLHFIVEIDMTRTSDFDSDKPLYTWPAENQSYNLIPRHENAGAAESPKFKSQPIRITKQSTGTALNDLMKALSLETEMERAIRAVDEHSVAGLLRKLEPERITITEAYTAKLTRADGTVEIRSG